MRLLAVALAAAVLCCCSDPAPSVPKRPAYPRVQLYEAQYNMPDFPVNFAVNSGASAAVERGEGSHWLTIDYPRYDATIYVTATPVANADAMRAEVDNRLRRMELNAGSTPVDETKGSTAGSDWVLTRARGASATPLQFILYPPQGTGWVVSGAAFLKGAIAPADSIAPVINALASDLQYALDHYSEP